MHIFSRFAACALALLGLLAAHPALAWNPAPAQPASVLFYPNEAQVTVAEQAAPEALPWGGAGFVLALPASARQDTFLLAIDGVPAGGWFPLNDEQRQALLAASGKSAEAYKTLLPEKENDPERKALLQTLTALADDRARLEGESAAAEARLELWRKTLDVYGQAAPGRDDGRAPASNAEEADRLDAAYARQYPALHAEGEQLRRALHDVTQAHAVARRKLDLFDRREGLAFVAVPFAGKGAPHALTYSYVLPATAELSYRLNALPDKGEIALGQDAALTQRSGFAWEKVAVQISTIRRDATLRPGHLRPWEIALVEKPKPVTLEAAAAPAGAMPMAPEQEYMARQRVRTQKNFVSAEELEGALSFDMAPAPQMQEHSTFRIWNLGERRIDNDSPLRVALEDKTLPASFLYTLRPALSPKGFLTARLDLPEALELPPGAAQFAVDGGAVGRQRFSFNGRKGDIFFGSDPRVTAVMRDLQRSGGEQGFFSKDQTLTRHWEITVSNARQRPVRALVEDPAPDGRDSSITIKTTSTPKPEAVVLDPEQGGAKALRWSFTLEPGTAALINHKVEISAPADKNKDLRGDRDGLFR